MPSSQRVAQLVRAPNRCLGGHGFDSRQGLIFLCPMLVSLLKRSSSLFITELKIYHLYYLLISTLQDRSSLPFLQSVCIEREGNFCLVEYQRACTKTRNKTVKRNGTKTKQNKYIEYCPNQQTSKFHFILFQLVMFGCFGFGVKANHKSHFISFQLVSFRCFGF